MEGSGIKEFMRLQDKVGKHLQEQLEVCSFNVNVLCNTTNNIRLK